ncbi:cation transporter [Marinobacter adhaerens]|uniref:Cation transporter n=1 Tax=Marinobacter adhaerens TaxID=1033846 RepID=A0A851HPH0_9GAMM|nr:MULTISPECIES: cation diffusion facilitator family transporter [Marinobacter]NWN90797.1 cation transporter [Marinobacter adhaerens]
MQQPDSPAQRHRQNLSKEMKAASRVTIIGMLLDAFLGIIKVIGGALFHSHALFVDGVHSFTDVASDLLVLGVMRLSRQEPDENHPYGHQRIETFGTLVLGSVLIAVGAALAWQNTLRLVEGDINTIPGWPVLVAAVISVASKEWIFRYTKRVGLEIRSDLIIANAWHSRTDALSSLVVLVATVGAMLGVLWLDVLAAVAISIIIIHIGWKFTWDSVQELVDTGLSTDDTALLKDIARNTDGVLDVHELRSRRMGQDILLDVHLVVRPEISVSEGHQIGMQVVSGMRGALNNILDIHFHIDAEDDEDELPAAEQLPSRAEVSRIIAERLEEIPQRSRLRLHYLRNKLHLEIFLDEPDATGIFTPENARKQLEGYPWFGSVRIWIAVL